MGAVGVEEATAVGPQFLDGLLRRDWPLGDGLRRDRVHYRLAAGIFSVDIGGAELQFGHPIAGGEQVMRADVDRNRSKVMKLPEQFRAMAHGSVVGLVVAEPAIDRLIGADGLVEVDMN